MIFVAALGLDFLQYIYKSIVWGSPNTYYWRKYGYCREPRRLAKLPQRKLEILNHKNLGFH